MMWRRKRGVEGDGVAVVTLHRWLFDGGSCPVSATDCSSTRRALARHTSGRILQSMISVSQGPLPASSRRRRTENCFAGPLLNILAPHLEDIDPMGPAGPIRTEEHRANPRLSD